MTVGTGVAAFGAVIAVILLQGGAGRGWMPRRPAPAQPGVGHIAPAQAPDAVAAPLQASQTIPTTAAGTPEQAVLDRAAAAPAENVGRWFACEVATDALPVWWPPQRVHAPPAAAGNGGRTPAPGAASTGDGHGQLARLGGASAPVVADLVCLGSDLHTWPVRAFFDVPAVGALPAIGQATSVALQLLGTDAAGGLQARYLRILDRPRLVQRPELPDWTALWTGPLLAGVPSEQRCTADAAVDVRDPAMLDPATLASTATEAGAPPHTWLTLPCRDARGSAVPILVHAPRDPAPALLGVGPGSEVLLQLELAGPDGLVAALPRLLSAPGPKGGGELRRALIDGTASIGRKVVCTSQGVPQPEVAQPEDPAVDLDKAPLADRKAWVVCAQPAGPAVQANLFLPGDHADRLLRVVRGSAVEARVLGVVGTRLSLLVERATPPPGTPAVPVDPLDPPDLRRLVLLGHVLRDPEFRCRLTRPPIAGAAALLPAAALRLSPQGPVGLGRLWCGDQVRPHAGQAVGVVGPEDAATALATVGMGSIVRLRFVGVVENEPIAVWAGRIEAEAGGAPAGPAAR
ncbi:MAG: hypothetical protein FJ100_08595 [Deltaproteobacteria bacterium]|nr:hypothetical protein [Deltaproteobacteria bacterium]